MSANHSTEVHHDSHPGYGFFTLIWLGLVALTALTVAIAGVNMGYYTVIIALLIACIKAMMVINYFMHIKFDHILVKILLLGCSLVLFVIFLFLGFDVLGG